MKMVIINRLQALLVNQIRLIAKNMLVYLHVKAKLMLIKKVEIGSPQKKLSTITSIIDKESV
jgi:hypothetical protein